MKDNVLKKANTFKGINDLALKGEIVVYGSTYMANFPFYELINKSKLENAVYNRSIEGLDLDEAFELLQICVLDIKPSKVFLALGEEDFDKPDAVEKYSKIIRKLRSELPEAKIYIICLPHEGEKADSFNRNIAGLCDNKKIICVWFSPISVSQAVQYKSRFKELISFFRSKPISFTEAFAIENI